LLIFRWWLRCTQKLGIDLDGDGRVGGKKNKKWKKQGTNKAVVDQLEHATGVILAETAARWSGVHCDSRMLRSEDVPPHSRR